MKLYSSLEKCIDNTLLKQTATLPEIISFVEKSVPYGFRSLVIPPFALGKAISRVEGRSCHFSAVVGFPLGYIPTLLKCREIEAYRNMGPAITDFDVVLNINLVKSKAWNSLYTEMQELSSVTEGKILKLIIETPLLTQEEIEHVCLLSMEFEGIDFIKTGTGFAGKPTTIDEVSCISKTLKGLKGIKVSGGVKKLEHVNNFLAAGATIFGSSSGIEIMEEAKRQK